MRIPKYIDKALKRRTKSAEMFNTNDYIVSIWLSRNGFDDDVDPADFHGGVESIVNPDDSEKRIREAILRKEKR